MMQGALEGLLQDCVQSCEGALAAAVFGFEGRLFFCFRDVSHAPLGLEAVRSEAGVAGLGAMAGGAGFVDLEGIGAELAGVFVEARRAAEILEMEPLSELTIRSDAIVVLFSAVSRERFMALLLAPEGNVGKGRFLLQKTARALGERLNDYL